MTVLGWASTSCVPRTSDQEPPSQYGYWPTSRLFAWKLAGLVALDWLALAYGCEVTGACVWALSSTGAATPMALELLDCATGVDGIGPARRARRLVRPPLRRVAFDESASRPTSRPGFATTPSVGSPQS